MIEVVFDIKATLVQRALAALRGRDLNTGPVMRAIARRLRNTAIDAFTEQRSPFGERWPSLARATIESRVARLTASAGRRKDGRLYRKDAERATNIKMLQDRGDLKKIHSSATSTSAEVSASVKYAAVQHFGGIAGRKSARVQIPSRKFFPIDEDGNMPESLRQSIMTMLRDHYDGRK